MDLTPFFQNVERIAGALERIADALTKPVISVGSPFQAPVALYAAREEEEIPEWPDGADEVIERLSARASVPILAAAAELAGPAPEIAPPAPQDEPGAPSPAAHEERTSEPPAPATGDPVEAAVLRLHSTGTTTYSGIAKALNAQGLLSHMGTPFHPPGVKKLMARLGLDSPHSYNMVGYRRRTAAEIRASSNPLQAATEAAREFELANIRLVAEREQRAAAILDAAAAPVSPQIPLRPVAAALADVVEKLRAEAPKVDVTEAVITGGPPQDHLDTTRHLSPRTRTRYDLYKRHKKGGGQALSQMELDQMEAQFLARGGQVTKLPACTSSDGYDHLKGQG